MKLQIFDKSCETTTTNRQGLRTISMSAKTGQLYIAKQLQKDLNLEANTPLIIAKDGDSKCDWFVAFNVENDNAYRLMVKNNGSKEQRQQSLYTTARQVVQGILKDLKGKQSASLLVSNSPVEINGVSWYRLITAKPIRMK